MRTCRARAAIAAQCRRTPSQSTPTGYGPRVRVAAVLVLLLFLAACGGSSSGPRAVVVALDFTPNPVHAPIYMAARRPSHGVRLQIRKPGSGPDSLKLVVSGKADLGVLDIQDLAIAAE